MNTNQIPEKQIPEQDVKLLGKRVKLIDPYRPEEFVLKYGKTWTGFKYGIVIEVTGHKFDRQSRQQRPRNVFLHLFDSEGRLQLCGSREGVPIPTFADFHVSEFRVCADNMTEEEAQPFISQGS